MNPKNTKKKKQHVEEREFSYFLKQLPIDVQIYILSFLSIEIDFGIEETDNPVFKILNMTPYQHAAYFSTNRQKEIDSIYTKNIIPLLYGYSKQDLPHKTPHFLYKNLEFVFASRDNHVTFFNCITFHHTLVRLLSQCECATIFGNVITSGVSAIDDPIPEIIDEKLFRIAMFQTLHSNLLPFIRKNIHQLHLVYLKEKEDNIQYKYLNYFIPFLVQNSESLTHLKLTLDSTWVPHVLSALQYSIPKSLHTLIIQINGKYTCNLNEILQLHKGGNSLQKLHLLGKEVSLLIFPHTVWKTNYPSLQLLITDNLETKRMWKLYTTIPCQFMS